MFAAVGNVNHYLKAVDYQMKWQEKQIKGDYGHAVDVEYPEAFDPAKPDRNPAWESREPTKEEAAFRQMQEILEKHKVDYAMNGIDTKLRTGKQLSPSELKYLQQNHPEKYAQAQAVQRGREEFERRLKNCRTKEEVRRMRMYAVGMGLSDFRAAEKADDVERCVEVHSRVMALGDEHDRFTGSYEYAKLPENEYQRAKKRKYSKKVRLVRVVNYGALHTTYLDMIRKEQSGRVSLPKVYTAAMPAAQGSAGTAMANAAETGMGEASKQESQTETINHQKLRKRA